MRRQIGIAATVTLAAAIAGAPLQSRAGVIHTAATTAPVSVDTRATFDPAVEAVSVALTSGASRHGRVFLDTDIAGGVTLVPITTIEAVVTPIDEARASGPQNANSDCCGAAIVEQGPFAIGTAAFQVESFISNAVTASHYIYGGYGLPSGSYTTLGMVGMGNFALVAAGLIGLGLTRRRDYIPPG
jgi:hypothetical protein